MSLSLKGKKILLGISGGIAAYKCCELVRLFKKQEAEVRVIMTPSALNFVSPVTLSALSGNEVLINIFPEVDKDSTESVETKTWHVYNGIWADVFIVAPATANTIAKLVNGITDNFLTATVLSSRCPVVVVPTMDEDMYTNEVTSINISKLKELGFWVMYPDKGELASGLYGVGRMPEPHSIFSFAGKFLDRSYRDYDGKRVLVTAGPTYEPIDDVRFIGNYSSGKMGFSLAKAASQRGADVTLISGPSALGTPRNVTRINVTTSDQMFETVKNGAVELEPDIVIMSAAVADYKPKEIIKGKIKKSGDSSLKIDTVKTVDILEYLGINKKGFKLVGFALETANEIEYAKDKLARKNLDLIVVNNPTTPGAGFNTDTNVVTIIDKTGKAEAFEKMTKFEVSQIILDKLILM